MEQSKFESWLEITINQASGFIIAWVVWVYIVVPLIHLDILEVTDATYITIIYTVFMTLRAYFWRRFFNRGLHTAVHNFAKRLYTRGNIIGHKYKAEGARGRARDRKEAERYYQHRTAATGSASLGDEG